MEINEKLIEIQNRFDENLAKAQKLDQEIAKLRDERNALQLPLLEDQGAIKTLKEMLN